MANPDAKGAPKPPPHLRVSDDESRECDSCTHFERGKCALYDYLPVDDEWVCDDWKKGSQTDDDEPDDEPSVNRSGTMDEARTRVREHFRRRRAAQASGQ